MASQNYELMISYPDAHVEIIEETFPSVEAAVTYGKSILNQIKATEAYHANKGDILGEKVHKKPYFEVSEKDSHKVVYKGK